MDRHKRRAALVCLSVAVAACTDHVVAPAAEVPIAASYPAIASTFTVQTATASDSRVPTITAVGDSVLVTMVVPTICGRDTVMAGAARDSLVVTLRRTLLPLPCAILLPDVRIRAAAVATSHPRVVVVSVHTLDFTDTTRALIASAVLGTPLPSPVRLPLAGDGRRAMGDGRWGDGHRGRAVGIPSRPSDGARSMVL